MTTPKEKFGIHVKSHDLKIVFDCAGHESDALAALRKAAIDVFEPYSSALEADDGDWIQEDWEASAGRGFTWQLKDSEGAIDFASHQTSVSLEPMEVKLASLPSGIREALVTLYSSKGWHVSRKGDGIKSVLGESDWEKISAKAPAYAAKFNTALEQIGKFDPEHQEACAFRYKLITAENWDGGKTDLSVPFHLVWPQYYPIWYKGAKNGYSQIPGLHKLLDQLQDHLFYTRNQLDFRDNYDHYAAAYRVILFVYQCFVETRKVKTPHFDYLTLLLAELDPQTETTRMLLTRKALVLYGVPGTGKTHAATEEIGPAIASDKRISTIQFHPGYSYADFIIGIRPKSEAGGVTYPVVPGILYRIAAEAALSLPKDKDAWVHSTSKGNAQEDEAALTEETRFVLVIDEINRAELSRVLGEVMMKMEYRACYQNGKNRADKDQTMPLPHMLPAGEKVLSIFKDTELPEDPFLGGSRFFMPDNLYLIGTMNHVDRSISGFDMALRRRFAWAEHKFSAAKLREKMKKNAEEIGLVIINTEDFVKRCRQFNQWIEEGKTGAEGGQELPFQHEHALGHTFFSEIVGILSQETIKEKCAILPRHLERLWLYNLRPQLEDALGYEVGAYRDAMRTLGKNFTKKFI